MAVLASLLVAAVVAFLAFLGAHGGGVRSAVLDGVRVAEQTYPTNPETWPKAVLTYEVETVTLRSSLDIDFMAVSVFLQSGNIEVGNSVYRATQATELDFLSHFDFKNAKGMFGTDKYRLDHRPGSWVYDSPGKMTALPMRSGDLLLPAGKVSTFTVSTNMGDGISYDGKNFYMTFVPVGMTQPLSQLGGISLSAAEWSNFTGLSSFTIYFSSLDDNDDANNLFKAYWSQGSLNPKYADEAKAGGWICQLPDGTPTNYYTVGFTECTTPGNNFPCPCAGKAMSADTGACSGNNLYYNHCPNIISSTHSQTSFSYTSSINPYVMTLNSVFNGGNAAFANFQGTWKFVGESIQSYAVMESVTWSSSDADASQLSWATGIQIQAKQGAGVFFAKAELTETLTETVTYASTETITATQSGTKQVTCTSAICGQGKLYQWQLSASTLDPIPNTGTVTDCSFVCVPYNISKTGGNPNLPPQCPAGSCGDQACSCCSEIWKKDDSTPQGNFLCDYVKTN